MGYGHSQSLGYQQFLIWASRCVETIVKHGILEEVTSSVELLHNVSCLLSSVYLNQLCVRHSPVRQWSSFTEEKQASRRWTLSKLQLWQKLMARLSMQLQHLNRRSWYCITSQRIGAPLVGGLHQCSPNSTRKLRSLEWRSSSSQETRAKMPWSPTWKVSWRLACSRFQLWPLRGVEHKVQGGRDPNVGGGDQGGQTSHWWGGRAG